MSLSPEREGRLTASTFGAAMGINPYQSRQALYRQIKGIGAPFEGNEATEHGTLNEPNAIDAYEINQGVIVLHANDKQKLVISEEHNWLGCTPDGFTERLVEAKCPFHKMYDDIPAHYMPQVQGQMFITGFKQCDFIAWSPEELKIWRVDFSQEYWDLEFKLLNEFWESVQNNEEPKRRKKPTMPTVHYELII